jgi:hypothetical protein
LWGRGKNIIKGIIHLHILKLSAFAQTEDTESEKETTIIFQQDGVSPTFSRKV